MKSSEIREFTDQELAACGDVQGVDLRGAPNVTDVLGADQFQLESIVADERGLLNLLARDETLGLGRRDLLVTAAGADAQPHRRGREQKKEQRNGRAKEPFDIHGCAEAEATPSLLIGVQV